jgi:hypothetical protein
MYQQALSKWYGEAAGHDFTDECIAKLIRELQAVTKSKGAGPSYVASTHYAYMVAAYGTKR